jgi:uncharacterized surface protein with fasciclin (FAS1) repeats
MKYKQLRSAFLLLLVSLLTTTMWKCQDIYDQPKYQEPPWQEGKIFTQVENEEDLSTFARFLEKSGYDTILNTSGSYAVFAPTNEAFEAFFQDHPEYQTLLESEGASEKINKLVEFQIIYNAWSKNQFRILDVSGWIDPDDNLREPRAYKRQTLYREDNQKYRVKKQGQFFQIVDSSESNNIKTAYTEANKYIPIFYKEYLNIYDLTGSDYEYYFNNTFIDDSLYYAESQMGEQIPAENGFVYKTDRVVLPLPNAEEIMERGHEGYTYNKFRNLIFDFSELNLNLKATFEQEGAAAGENIDSLYNVRFPDLVFNIHSELTGFRGNQLLTLRDHHGLIAPTDQALESFTNEYFSQWGDIEGIPKIIKEIIVNSHMSYNAIYPTDINKGFLNGERDSVLLNEANIIQKTYGSNCSFLGVNEAIVPRVIKSICQPMYLNRNFSKMLYATEYTGVLPALKNPNVNYAFYIPGDQSTSLSAVGDSSLIRVIDDIERELFHFETYDQSLPGIRELTRKELRNMILNQVATEVPEGTADKEFIRNLGGQYIIVNNKDNIVSGTSPTKFGFEGDSTIYLTPEEFSGETDNGKAYKVQTFFSFQSGGGWYGNFISKYPEFLDLLRKAGLYDPVYYEFPFLTDGESYTVFIPSDEALENYGAGSLPKFELRRLLQYHFVRGDLLFTDGKKPSREYPTTLLDERSDQYTSIYSKLNIKTSPDLIQILDKNGDVYLEIPEKEGVTNQIVNYDPNEQSASKYDYITTGVIHNIDKVLIRDSLFVF